MAHRFAPALAALSVSACAATGVSLANPEPHIGLPKDEATLRLDLAAMPDRFEAKGIDGQPVEVSNWRATLANGFRNGFAAAFQLTDDSQSRFTIQLVSVDLWFAPRSGPGHTTAVLRYRAWLFDGQSMRDIEAVVEPEPSKNQLSPTEQASMAVAAMYESIARQLFRLKSPEAAEPPGAVKGSLSKAVIGEIIRSHTSEIRRCYEQALQAAPLLHGKLRATFVIGGDGTVREARLESSTLASPPVESCVLGDVLTWTFPPPVGHGLVSITYPWVFSSELAPEPPSEPETQPPETRHE